MFWENTVWAWIYEIFWVCGGAGMRQHLLGGGWWIKKRKENHKKGEDMLDSYITSLLENSLWNDRKKSLKDYGFFLRVMSPWTVLRSNPSWLITSLICRNQRSGHFFRNILQLLIGVRTHIRLRLSLKRCIWSQGPYSFIFFSMCLEVINESAEIFNLPF